VWWDKFVLVIFVGQLQFTMDQYETYIMPKSQASFVYHFQPSESFYARPFGLTMNIYYKDLVSDSFMKL